MLHHHVVHFLFSDLLTKLVHSKTDVLFSNFARLVRIKCIEDGLEARFGQEFMIINRCRKEFTVVNLLIVVKVHLINHLTNLCIAYIHFLLNKNIVKFLSFDHACSICIYRLKLSSEILDLLLSR